jgi:hypothetical protein
VSLIVAPPTVDRESQTAVGSACHSDSSMQLGCDGADSDRSSGTSAQSSAAKARVVGDMAEQLGRDTLILRGALERESLHLSVLELP